jgi:hypothetical protein
MPPPSAPAETIPQDNGDIRLKRISDPIEAGEDGRGLREEIRRQQRERDPIYEWKAGALPEAGEHESFSKQLRRASESMYEARVGALAKDFSTVPGANEESARRAAEFMAEAPPIKVPVVNDAGQPLPALLDDQPVSAEHEGFRNLAEARRAMKNYRDAQDRAAQALADELTHQEELERQAEQAQVQAQAEQREAEHARQVQAQAQAAAVEAQRQAQALNEVQRMSLSEAELVSQIQRHDQWAVRAFPELNNPEALRQTAQTNPARLKQMQQEFARSHGARAQLAQLQQGRALRENQIVQYQAVQRQAYNEQQDAAFTKELAKRHPQFASDEGRTKMTRLAREYLEKDMGLTKAQIDAEWKGGALRSFGAQVMLADAVANKLAKESIRDLNSKRAAVPPVQRPGTYRPAGAGAMDRIRDLEVQLANATGNRSVKIMTQLHQARRDAGLV